MRKKFVIGIDPSGSFSEGKGTTGVCLFDTDKMKVNNTFTIQAKDYNSDISYWSSHVNLLKQLISNVEYDTALAIEEYLLYASAASAQINSRFETSQLIGVLRYTLRSVRNPLRMQRAADVIHRWSNKILVHKEIIEPFKRSFSLPGRERRLYDHELDAIRHAVHYATFYNK